MSSGETKILGYTDKVEDNLFSKNVVETHFKFVPSKRHIREIMLYSFFSKKTAAQTHRLFIEVYGEHSPSEASCRKWFARFRIGDFNVADKEHGKPPKKFNDTELETLLKENPKRTLNELANALNVNKATVSRRLHQLGMIKKVSKIKNHCDVLKKSNKVFVKL